MPHIIMPFEITFDLRPGVDSAGNIYAVENNWGSSAGGGLGAGVATAFFMVDPITGLGNSVIPLLEGGIDVGFGFGALDILPDGRFMHCQVKVLALHHFIK